MLLGHYFPRLFGFTHHDVKKIFPIKQKLVVSAVKETGYMHIQSTKPDTAGKRPSTCGKATHYFSIIINNLFCRRCFWNVIFFTVLMLDIKEWYLFICLFFKCNVPTISVAVCILIYRTWSEWLACWFDGIYPGEVFNLDWSGVHKPWGWRLENVCFSGFVVWL